MIKKAIIAIVIGLWFACTFTHIIYSPCLASDNPGVPYNAPSNEDSLVRCAEFAKAIDKPHDFFHNKQGSLSRFAENLAKVSLFIFAILNVPLLFKKRNLKGGV